MRRFEKQCGSATAKHHDFSMSKTSTEVQIVAELAIKGHGITRKLNFLVLILVFKFCELACMSANVSLPGDVRAVPQDLRTPAMTSGEPAPGKRAQAVTAGYQSTGVYHALYLPTNWKPHGLYPVIIEYAGNGLFTNRFGDFSNGSVEGSNLGYGMSAGRNFIWVCMPFVAVTNGVKSNARNWWGDVEETVTYCERTVRDVCERFGGDTNAVILAGFSRGAIAGNYIGLHDDKIASLWRAFVLHSHYDGVITNWHYAGADRESALVRLKRLHGRPQFISQELSTDATRMYLEQTGVQAPFMFQALNYRNHCDDWVLRDLPERAKLRAWLKSVLKEYNNLAE
jgi:hypothetical protein